MLSIDQALKRVLDNAAMRPPVRTPAAGALGLALAEDVTSDIDSPPHDKAMVDGYAVRADDLAGGSAELRILEEVIAGEVPQHEVSPGCATRIMTGAPIPAGADAVVMIEHCESLGDDRVRVQDTPSAGRNILTRGTSVHSGEIVLAQGSVIRPIEVGLLCEVGKARVVVPPRPTVAVLSTGNELVPAEETPAAGQIRNSNSPMLAAAVTACGGEPLNLGIARDDEQSLAEFITQGLECDVLLLSGGVSAGVLDLVPRVLKSLGVREVFHKVRLKPGKPLWFGIKDDRPAPRLVFGLPGNPVSSFVCFQLFVRPALRRMMGHQHLPPETISAVLQSDFTHHGDRPTYWPAALESDGEQHRVRPLAWKGSADIRGFAAASALAIFPPGDRTHPAGERIAALPLV